MFVGVGADPWEVRSPPGPDPSGTSRRAQRRGGQRAGTGILPLSVQSITGCRARFAAPPGRGTASAARTRSGPEGPRDETYQREGMGAGGPAALLALEKQSRCGFPAVPRCPSPTEVFTAFPSQGRAPSLAEGSVSSGRGVYSAEHPGRGRAEDLASPGAPGPLRAGCAPSA